MPAVKISSAEEYKKFINAEIPSVVLFSADWADQCKHVEEVLIDLSKLHDENLQFGKLNAEDFPEVSTEQGIDAVPTVIIYRKGAVVDRVDGVDIASLTAKVRSLVKSGSAKESLEDRLKALINKAPIMIFMKGDRNAPRCGFSRQLVEIMNGTGTAYETFDILTDEDVRQGLKKLSDWPTYPQVYVKGQLIGGLDIIKEMLAADELKAALEA